MPLPNEIDIELLLQEGSNALPTQIKSQKRITSESEVQASGIHGLLFLAIEF